MHVLIVEEDADLGALWAQHLRRQNAQVCVCHSEAEAIKTLRMTDVQVVILNLVLKSGSAFAVADFVQYRCPRARVIFVTSGTFFSDGSIFALIPNACAFVPCHMLPSDLAALVEHVGTEH